MGQSRFSSRSFALPKIFVRTFAIRNAALSPPIPARSSSRSPQRPIHETFRAESAAGTLDASERVPHRLRSIVRPSPMRDHVHRLVEYLIAYASGGKRADAIPLADGCVELGGPRGRGGRQHEGEPAPRQISRWSRAWPVVRVEVPDASDHR